ncbi:MAG TPA: hypothetical protein VKQ09_05910 [Sphingomonas sp.]|nr:hypothetical protein [Sphingomonas sp.]
MKRLPCAIIAGLMSGPAVSGFYHHDVWLGASFVAGALVVLFAPELFGELAEDPVSEPVDPDNMNPGAQRYYSLEPRR